MLYLVLYTMENFNCKVCKDTGIFTVEIEDDCPASRNGGYCCCMTKFDEYCSCKVGVDLEEADRRKTLEAGARWIQSLKDKNANEA